MFKSRLQSRVTKTELFIAYLHPIIVYVYCIRHAIEKWASMKSNELKLQIFEMKMSRMIFSPTQNPELGCYKEGKMNISKTFSVEQKCLEAKILE